MEIVLDNIDKKLLSYLYHHYREPLTKIAKACKVSRDQVEYRLEKYEKQGLIKKYATIFNYRLLGYDEFIVVLIKCSSSIEKTQLKNELEKYPDAITVFDCIGKYDLGTDLVFRNKDEFQKEWGNILKKYTILEHSIFITTALEFFPLKEFELTVEGKSYPINPEKSTKKHALDEKDIKILRIIEENGRARIVDIAKKTKLSCELILYKLKKLHEDNIILGNRIIFDLEKFGYFFGNLRIKLKNLDEEAIVKISKYCKYHKYINAISFGIGEYNCLVQVFYKEEKQFRDTLKEFLEKFKDNIHTSDIILIENEGEIHTLPF
ncbi:MAG: Lrp/AsnC family transcriptional regulator [Candidatus Woesearchaeota archaeon]